MTRARLAGLLLALAPAPQVVAAAGSWVADTAGVRVAVPGRYYEAEVIAPRSAAGASGAVAARVGWEFAVPPERVVDAWLCHRRRCLPLSRQRGDSAALRGVPATGPFRFRFALPGGERRAVEVRGLRLRVDFQAPVNRGKAGIEAGYLTDGLSSGAE